jgi:hypothetical protein
MLLHAVPTHNTTHIIYIAVVITDKRYCSYSGANTCTTESTDYTVCATVSLMVNSTRHLQIAIFLQQQQQ